MAALRAKRSGSPAAWPAARPARALVAAAGRIDRDGAAGGQGIVSGGSVNRSYYTSRNLYPNRARLYRSEVYTGPLQMARNAASSRWRHIRALPHIARQLLESSTLFIGEGALTHVFGPGVCGAEAEFKRAPASWEAYPAGWGE